MEPFGNALKRGGGFFFFPSASQGNRHQRLCNEPLSGFVAFTHFFKFPPNHCLFVLLFAVYMTEWRRSPRGTCPSKPGGPFRTDQAHGPECSGTPLWPLTGTRDSVASWEEISNSFQKPVFFNAWGCSYVTTTHISVKPPPFLYSLLMR